MNVPFGKNQKTHTYIWYGVQEYSCRHQLHIFTRERGSPPAGLIKYLSFLTFIRLFFMRIQLLLSSGCRNRTRQKTKITIASTVQSYLWDIKKNGSHHTHLPYKGDCYRSIWKHPCFLYSTLQTASNTIKMFFKQLEYNTVTTQPACSQPWKRFPCLLFCFLFILVFPCMIKCSPHVFISNNTTYYI